MVKNNKYYKNKYYNNIYYKMSKVSIIMPVYNNRLYVETAIRSVLNQTYKNWELIIINDKSTDGVEKILEKYQDNDKIKIISNRII